MSATMRRARSTGTTVELIDAQKDPGFDSDGGRWVTICEHGSLVNHQTRSTAESFMAFPNNWCGLCQDIIDERLGQVTFGRAIFDVEGLCNGEHYSVEFSRQSIEMGAHQYATWTLQCKLTTPERTQVHTLFLDREKGGSGRYLELWLWEDTAGYAKVQEAQ